MLKTMMSAKQLSHSDEHWSGGARLDHPPRGVDSIVRVLGQGAALAIVQSLFPPLSYARRPTSHAFPFETFKQTSPTGESHGNRETHAHHQRPFRDDLGRFE